MYLFSEKKNSRQLIGTRQLIGVQWGSVKRGIIACARLVEYLLVRSFLKQDHCGEVKPKCLDDNRRQINHSLKKVHSISLASI